MDFHAPFGVIAAFIIGLLLSSAVSAVIGAFFVQISTRIVAGFKPAYGKAWHTAFVVLFVSAVIRVVFMRIDVIPLNAITLMLLSVGIYCVQSAIFGRLVEYPDTGSIGFGRGLLVTLTQWVVGAICLCPLILVLTLCAPKFVSKFLHSNHTAFSRTGRLSLTAMFHLGKGDATVQNSQREAVRLYPELGVPGSKFNAEFVARYMHYQREHPDYFKNPVWPIWLAEETDEALKPK